MPETQDPDKARRTWSLPHWSGGYVDVGEAGDLLLRPRRQQAVSLPAVMDRARAEGLRTPLLLRFPDILADRLERLEGAFAAALDAHAPGGQYTAVYPIKVNQQKEVVTALLDAGRATDGPGLEAGSKPELMAVLALAEPGTLVVCNGYKDRQYLRLALIGRRMGLDVHVVIEKLSELALLLEEAEALGIEPRLGVRVRLASLGTGKWQNTGGSKGKFGLSPRQVLQLLDDLRHAGHGNALRMLHFHMGSQISNLRDIATGMREAVRYFVALRSQGVPLDIVDVGGGLGVDYEGSRSRSFNSINYSMEQYAMSVVQPLAEACREHGLPMPRLVTEAGRAMTAHHAVLVVGINEVESCAPGRVPRARKDEPAVLQHLRNVHAALGRRPVLELYHEAGHHLAEGQTLFALGQMSLQNRARLDDLYLAIAHGVRKRLDPARRAHREVLDTLDERLVDQYFGNFSLFESLPDVWAIDQVFPIVPLTRLDEVPTRRGVLVDVTCDSDGRIDHYADAEGPGVSMPLHPLRDGERYELGIFMVGAYQETLGDIHNLFGDTDAVNVRMQGGGFVLERPRRGDTADLLLEYVGYELDALRKACADKLAASGLSADAVDALRAELEAGLTAYTYLNAER